MTYRINQSDAVSPVVGVMLMLSVTVMIAAIVSTYAGGFSGGTDKTPQSSLRAMPDLSKNRIYFEHNGGDPFSLNSVEVILRSDDSKVSLTSADAGSNKVVAFDEIGNSAGNSNVAIKAGDTFFVEGKSSSDGIKFGSLTLTNRSRIIWSVVDRETSRTISMGSFFL